MKLEISILLTTFALLSANLLLSGRRGNRPPAVQEREQAAELDALFRPVLLFSTTVPPMASC